MNNKVVIKTGNINNKVLMTDNKIKQQKNYSNYNKINYKQATTTTAAAITTINNKINNINRQMQR